MKLGERIKQRRTELTWTQDQLAQKAGISKGFLSDVENAKRSVSAETLLDLARVLGLSLDYLMTGEDEQNSAQQMVEIPGPLAQFAGTEGLSFPKTLMLLQMQRQIVAHRSSAQKVTDNGFDWRRFYESVKDFL